MPSDTTKKIGSWAFVIGLLVAVIAGLRGTGGTTTWILAVLGLIVGMINVGHGESKLFLIAAIAFMVSANSLALIFGLLEQTLDNIIVFVAPGAAVVALRALYDIAKEH